MKTVHLTLPMKYKGDMIRCGYNQGSFYMGIRGNTYNFYLGNKFAFIIGISIFFSLLSISFSNSEPSVIAKETVHTTPETITIPVSTTSINTHSISEKKDIMGDIMDEFDKVQAASYAKPTNFREKFNVQKQIIVTKYLIEAKVSRTKQLPDHKLLALNQEVGKLFSYLVLGKVDMKPHVRKFFLAEAPLKKIETALMEQAKYHVPASITLAQAALETGYGQKVVNNNFFGIKDMNHLSKPIMTTEYYTSKEFQYNKSKVVSYEKVQKGGRSLFKCLIRDSFADYKTPWESFRAHSIFLSQNKRYSPLFTKGLDYNAWAEKIGSTKYGGVGYATSPIYGELLKKIIQRYHLDLLDY